MAIDIVAERTSRRMPTQEELEALLSTLAQQALMAYHKQVNSSDGISQLVSRAESEAYTKVHAILAGLLGYELKDGSNG